MKNFFLALTCVGFLAFSVTSCEKDCKCTTVTDGVTIGTTTVKAKKCADLESETTVAGMVTKMTCE